MLYLAAVHSYTSKLIVRRLISGPLGEKVENQNMSGHILPFQGVMPIIAEDAFIAPNATVIGHVTIGSQSSVWFNTVIRGDVMSIRVGDRTNLQDGTIVHVTGGMFDTVIGSDVLIGHRAIIHGATLEDGCFIGMGATILDGAVVETGAMVAAGAMVTPGKRVKRGELWAGSPAKLFREIGDAEFQEFADGTEGYRQLGQDYKEALQERSGPK